MDAGPPAVDRLDKPPVACEAELEAKGLGLVRPVEKTGELLGRTVRGRCSPVEGRADERKDPVHTAQFLVNGPSPLPATNRRKRDREREDAGSEQDLAARHADIWVSSARTSRYRATATEVLASPLT